MDHTDKKSLLSKAELSIWLDTYDDIFSDFDSRPYTERAVSDDFLIEVQKMVREKPQGGVQLRLLMPAKQRDADVEAIVVKNLHSHFKKITHAVEQEIKLGRIKGIGLSLLGFACMITAAYITSKPGHSFMLVTLRVVLEPSGWFILWNGLESIFYHWKKRKADLDFNSKMAKAEISFLSF